MIRQALAPLLLALLLVPAAAGAQPPKGDPPFMRHLFKPELVMRHQRALALSAEQREQITGAIGQTQAQVLDIQWQMQEQAGELESLFSAAQIDEEATLAQLAQVIGFEQKVKLAHMRLLIRIRNLLTESQREQLMRLRRNGPHAR